MLVSSVLSCARYEEEEEDRVWFREVLLFLLSKEGGQNEDKAVPFYILEVGRPFFFLPQISPTWSQETLRKLCVKQKNATAFMKGGFPQAMVNFPRVILSLTEEKGRSPFLGA